LLEFELANVLSGIEYADYVICNEDEADCFGKVNKMEGASRQDIVKAILFLKKANQKRDRIAIVTQGKDPVLVAVKNEAGEVTITEYAIPPLTNEELVDTNGAGDSFVGGFLSQLYQGKDIGTCVSAGIYLSREVCKMSGAVFPP